MQKPGMIDPSDLGRYRPLLLIFLAMIGVWILLAIAWPKAVLTYFVVSSAAILTWLVVNSLTRRRKR
jgi:hypothetical protein